MARIGGTAKALQPTVPHPTGDSLSRASRRTSNVLHSRSQRQCAGVQGVRGRCTDFCAMSAERVAIAVGIVALALILGALGYQYGAGMPPCEMCHWQRWPHIAAAV